MMPIERRQFIAALFLLAAACGRDGHQDTEVAPDVTDVGQFASEDEFNLTQDSANDAEDELDALEVPRPDVSVREVDEPDAMAECEIEETVPVDPLGFSPPATVAITPGNSKSPVIASLCGAIHVVWHDFSRSPANLYHAMRDRTSTWHFSPLELTTNKSIFPEIIAHENHLHLVWQVDETDGPVVMHAIWNRVWSNAEVVMSGRLPKIALDAAGRVHVVAFDGNDVVHATGEGHLAEISKLKISEAFVNTLDLGLAQSGGEMVVGLATSPGETSYDIRQWLTKGMGWGPMETVYQSFGLSSDDLDVFASDSGPVWVWTEQDSEVPEDIPVVMKRPGESRPRRVSRESGFTYLPSMGIPSDGRAMVVWVTQRDTVALAREPFERDVELGGRDATFPRLVVGGGGVTHVVFSGRDDNAVQQIWYTSNAP